VSSKENLIASIVQAEWEMFQVVPNVGGPAGCQQDPKTFEIMRSSQAVSWSETALESYLDDLVTAQRSGRNLLTEKYARMMESTAPAEYAAIEHLLPPLTPPLCAGSTLSSRWCSGGRPISRPDSLTSSIGADRSTPARTDRA
jgi:hypothetical protein